MANYDIPTVAFSLTFVFLMGNAFGIFIMLMRSTYRRTRR